MTDSVNFEILDLHFQDESSVIASFLFETEEGLVLVETGPETVFEQLKAGIKKTGNHWKDVKHVLLTHIHFDHAGAAWKFAENEAKIYVHPVGLPHLNHPERLWNSAQRIYGNDMERLWGSMKPIPEKLLVPAGDGDSFRIGKYVFNAIYTPGHAVHHNVYEIGEIIFTGDAAGIKIEDGPVTPPCPPPDIHIEQWKKSIQIIRDLHPKALYLTHYGKVEDIGSHLDDLVLMLDDWANWIKPYYERSEEPVDVVTPLFVEYTQGLLREKEIAEELIRKYEKANPSYMSVAGLFRYWRLKAEGRI